MISPSRDLTSQESKRAILILDERSNTVQEADACLKQNGYVCYSSFDTQSASHAIQNHHDIAILLTAVTFNHSDNFSFVEKLLKQQPATRDFEVIFFSEKLDEQELLQALRIRACDFLHLPFHHDTLLQSIDIAMSRISARIQEKENSGASHQIIREMQNMLATMTERLSKIENQGANYLQGSNVKKLPHTQSQILQKVAEEKPPPSLAGIDKSSVDKAHRILGAKRQFFSHKVSSDASLIMLLELYEVRQSEKEMPVTALCYSSETPQTTALRRLDGLEKNGFLRRYHDPADRRRVLIRLTPAGEKEVRQYLDFIEKTA